MARTIPPVISKTYDLMLWLLKQVPKFPRSHKFVLGDRIQNLILDILGLLIEAAYTRNKLDLLKRTTIEIEKLRYLIRTAKDLNFMSVKSYEYVSSKIDEVGRMVGGWLRQQEKR